MQEVARIPNPRRVTAEDSVCLKKSPSQIPSSNISVTSNRAADGEDEESRMGKAGSIAAESAKTWFDDSNKNVSNKAGSKFYADDDPPFFLRHKSSSDESLPNPHKPAPATNAMFLRRFPNATSLLSRNQESSSEDFRGVIDDLTVENRKLRKKLRKYEQVHCGELQGDKLFELRIHGLPASKKRKLEKALQEFASSLGDSPDDEQMTSAFAQKLAKVPKRNPGLHHNASSSGTSNSRTFGDSAYASMSNSNSSGAQQSRGEARRGMVETPANDQAVKAYLRNLSRGLLPKHPPVLTDKIKKQVVIQRLEQLFTGSRDNTGKDSQSRQQQEVSQSAANADRKTHEAEGHRVMDEGRRESKIFTSEEELQLGTRLSALDRADTDDSGTTSSTTTSLDQRPTRPLDLDPSRAQIPEDNIEYMKHLGFDSPQMQVEKNMSEDEGWIYLNLLTSMAQLHILNVTPEFVRNAVREISTQLELAPDGARIRWKGGKRPTLISFESGEASTHSSNFSYDTSAPQQINNRNSSKSLENQSGSGSGHNQSSHDPSSSYNAFDKYRPMLLDQTNTADPYQYRPLFYHDNRSSESGGHSYDDDKNSSLSSGALESSKLGPDGGARGGDTANKRVSHSRLRKAADPIIFYNKARFYTDLSKDDETMPYNCPLYTKAVKSVIGVEEASEDSGLEDKGPLSKGIELMTISNTQRNSQLDNLPTIHGLLSHGARQLPQSAGVQDSEMTRPSVTFEASGIGGVIPGDNFAIAVEYELQQTHNGKKNISTKVISSKTTDMLPSSLPPPSYAFLPFSSSSESDDEESDSDGDVEMSDEDEDAYEQDIKSYIPPKFLNSFSSEGNSEDNEDDDMSDDSSIDMLAHARETEPETVAAAEREFDDNINSSDEDERMDIAAPPSSSIVATLGDQSFEKDVISAEKADVIAVGGSSSKTRRGSKGGPAKTAKAQRQASSASLSRPKKREVVSSSNNDRKQQGKVKAKRTRAAR